MAEKKKQIICEEIKRSFERSAAFKDNFGDIKKQSESSPQPLKINFVDKNVEKAYRELDGNPKLKAFLEDIGEKPWSTQGEGKPEVLRRAYKGHKGCLARRLDHENRFVYKVTGPREILILDCQGHYGYC